MPRSAAELFEFLNQLQSERDPGEIDLKIPFQAQRQPRAARRP
jgi:hypothetical protein